MDSDQATKGKLYDKELTGRILAYARPYTRAFVVGFVVLIFMTFAQNMIPILIKQAIDRFIGEGGAGLAPDVRIEGLRKLCILIGVMAAGIFVFRIAKTYLMTWIGQHVVNDMRNQVFAKVLDLPVQYFDRNPIGRLMTRITSDLDSLQMFVKNGLIGMVANILLLLGVMGFMLYIDVTFALLLFTTIPILGVILTIVNMKTRKAHRNVRGKQSALNARLQEFLTGMITIQLFNREARSIEEFNEASRDLRDAQIKAARWTSYYFPVIEVMRAMATVIILLTGGWMLLQGKPVLGTLIAFLFYVRDFFRPLEDLADQSHLLQTAMASSERLFSLLDEPLVIEDQSDARAIASFKGAVEFRDVSFAYIPGTPVLTKLSFAVAPGESLAIVGASGAGKTSIISLLARFYDVQEGAILVDGVDVKAYAQSELRQRVGMVLQDPVIFSGTIATNISLHHPDITREQIIEAATYVNAHTFISQMADGYDSLIGERGSTLSTGQKQLLALARALVQNPDILLVLDEATANVDTETERLIQQALQKLMKDRTTIVIAHRLSTIRNVDRILVMRKGTLIESGTHNELVQTGGYYRTLYELLSHAPA
ncbi:MAG: ATP-binding cassette subfamily B multidrug efflux pump [Verrucomicrobiales bacterium]|jgi:ATP-binding cassette subfamily B multidrug efflux pump